MIVVCPLSQIERAVELHAPSHMITLLDPDNLVPTPPRIASQCHLRVGVHDIRQSIEGQTAPEARHAAEIVQFVSAWPREAPILIHCWAGVSRSTAAAFITLCATDPDTAETEHAARLRAAAPFANPNPMLVRHADDALARGGRMSAAIEALDLADPVDEGDLFALPVSVR